ncbi:type VI secretion system tip protein VgrG, partial [Agrobacterium fabrum]|nr:type VI secretion system tip protein VgrG [Agrobacterium fabrum]
PRADAGTALAGSGSGVGSDASGLFPLPGIMNTIIGAFQSTSVGVAKAEQVGVSKVTNIGQTEVRQVGKQQNLTIGKEQFVEIGTGQYTRVGEKITINVGKLYNLVSEEKYHGEAKVWEIFADDEIRLSTPGGYISLTKSGIKLFALKIDIEGNQINFKKGGPGESGSCLKSMSKNSTPFVRI